MRAERPFPTGVIAEPSNRVPFIGPMHNVNPALPALSRAVEEEIALHNDRSTICAELQEPDLHAGMGLLSIIQKNKCASNRSLPFR